MSDFSTIVFNSKSGSIFYCFIYIFPNIPKPITVILVYNLEIGVFTPPFGIGVYLVSSVGEVSPDAVFKELLPFYLPLLIALIFITFFPQISLFLPRLLLD